MPLTVFLACGITDYFDSRKQVRDPLPKEALCIYKLVCDCTYTICRPAEVHPQTMSYNLRPSEALVTHIRKVGEDSREGRCSQRCGSHKGEEPLS